jgi:hypothetical protein
VLALVSDHAGAYVAPAVVSVVAILVWMFLVTPSWVERAADVYAERLMEAADVVADREAAP